MLKKQERRILEASFLLPFLLLILLYALAGITPFGEHSLLIADGEGQYQSFFALYQDIFARRVDPFYSFGKLLGGPISGLYAYYLASPFNLLLLLFPREKIALGVDWIILLKLSACGLTMALYLRGTGRLKPESLVFTTAYALCGYNTAYAWCVLWLDAVSLLPLVALGIERIWREGKPLLYMLSLGLAIISCFYTGYMLCGFSVLYFLWLLLRDVESLRRLPWKRLWQYALASLLAGGLSAWMLLPGLSILGGGVTDSPYTLVTRMTYPAALRILEIVLPEAAAKDGLVIPVLLICALLFMAAIVGLLLALFRLKRRPALVTGALCLSFFVLWYALVEVPICREELAFSQRHILSKLVLGLVPYWEFWDGSPNFYTGSLALLLGLSFFLNRTFPRRERAAAAVLLLSLLASACFYLPNLAWHGFEENNCFNYRWSFLFSFVLLILAARSSAHREGLSRGSLLLPGGAAAAILLFSALQPIWFQKAWMLLTSAAFLCVELGLLLLWRKGSVPARRILCLVGIGALCFTTGWSFSDQEGFSQPVGELGAAISREEHRIDPARPGTGEFWRIRKTGSISNKNDPLLLNYAGVVHYSSAENHSTISFLTHMGLYTWPKILANGDKGESRAVDALLGVGRLLGDSAPTGYLRESEVVWKNPYALPIAFLADPGADCSGDMDTQICRNLNLTYSLLTGEETAIFRPAEADGLRLTVDRDDPLYLQSWSPAITVCTVRSSGKILANYQDIYYPNAIYLGSFAPGTELEIEVKGTEQIPPVPEEAVFYEDSTALKRAVQLLTAERCETEILSASRLEIRTGSQRERLLVLSIPADKGWTLRLDGAPVLPNKALGVLLALRLPAGDHSVSLRYTPPGLAAGLGLSALSLAAVAAWLLLQRRKRAQS